MDLDGSLKEQLLELRGGARVVLIRRNDERERPAAPARLDRAGAHVVKARR